MNDDRCPVKFGVGIGHRNFYCGRRLGKKAIPGSDGRCGPNNGPQCASCARLQAKWADTEDYCAKNHKLTPFLGHGTHHTCDVCGKHMPTHGHSLMFRCVTCDYDKCDECVNPTQEDDLTVLQYEEQDEDDLPANAALPHNWTNAQAGITKNFDQMVYLGRRRHAFFDEMLKATYVAKSTRDRPCPKGVCPKRGGGCKCVQPHGDPGLPSEYRVRRVIRVEDSEMWQKYVNKREEIRAKRTSEDMPKFDPPMMSDQVIDKHAHTRQFGELDDSINEVYLWHGTNVRAALSIAQNDFNINLAGENTGTMYGCGAYVGESSTKADEYARDEPGGYYEGVYAMLLCRVVMGKFYYTEERDTEAGDKIATGEFDSTLGDRQKSAGTFRELVVYDSDQLYPEYIVIYTRVHKGDDKLDVEKMLEVDFHMQLPVYWRNCHRNPITDPFSFQWVVREHTLHTLQRLVASCMPDMKPAKVVKARRIENSKIWCSYVDYKKSLKDILKGRIEQAKNAPVTDSAEDVVLAQSGYNASYYCNIYRAEEVEDGIVEVRFQVFGDGSLGPLQNHMSSRLGSRKHNWLPVSFRGDVKTNTVLGTLIYENVNVPESRKLNFRFGSSGYSFAELCITKVRRKDQAHAENLSNTLMPLKPNRIPDESTWLTAGAKDLMRDSGKFYHEVQLSDHFKMEDDPQLGWLSEDFQEGDWNDEGVGDDENGWAVNGCRKLLYHAGGKPSKSKWPRRWRRNDIIGLAVDIDAGEMTFSLNGEWVETASTNFDAAGKKIFPAVSLSGYFRMNLVRDSWLFPPPSEDYEEWADTGNFTRPTYKLGHFMNAEELDGNPESGHVLTDTILKRMQSEDCVSYDNIEDKLNEHMLWHGTSKAAAEAIVKNDFRIARGEAKHGKRFGEGAYFAEDLKKSLAYTDPDENNITWVLLCRVVCGDYFYTEEEFCPDAHVLCVKHGKHSILANPPHPEDMDAPHGPREFIILDEKCVYPEFVLELEVDGEVAEELRKIPEEEEAPEQDDASEASDEDNAVEENNMPIIEISNSAPATCCTNECTIS